MALEATIMADLKEAMKAKDKITLEALRAIKTAILNEKTAAGAKEMTEADELKLLTKLRKQRVESMTIFRDQGREDLAEGPQPLLLAAGRGRRVGVAPVEAVALAGQLDLDVRGHLREVAHDAPHHVGRGDRLVADVRSRREGRRPVPRTVG